MKTLFGEVYIHNIFISATATRESRSGFFHLCPFPEILSWSNLRPLSRNHIPVTSSIARNAIPGVLFDGIFAAIIRISSYSADCQSA